MATSSSDESSRENVLDITVGFSINDSLDDGKNTLLFSKRRAHSIILVILMACILLPIYFVKELPSGMEQSIIEVMMISTTQYIVLYELFSWPSILISSIVGLIIDKLKPERMLPLLLSLVVIGQSLWSLGGFLGQYWIMVVGRTCTGVGGEMVFVCLVGIIATCFPAHINLVNGLLLGVGRLGATITVNVNSVLYEQFKHISNHNHRTGFVYLISVVLITIGFLSSLLLWFMFVRGKYKREAKPTTSFCPKIKRPFTFPLYYALLISIAGIFYTAVLTPNSIGELYYMEKYGINLPIANFINSFVHILPIVLCPLFGLIIYKTGHNLVWILTAIIIGVTSHMILAYSNGEPAWAYIGSLTGALSYSMFTTSLWPVLSLIIKPELLGLAYGVQGSLIGLVEVIVTVTVGYLADNWGYFMVQLFYTGLSLVGLGAIIVLNCIDVFIEGRKLNVSGKRLHKVHTT